MRIVTIRLQPSPACPFRGDAFRMGQVFTILMENAVRYGRDGGHLDYAALRQGHYIEFAMTGPACRPSFTGNVQTF
jgi:signal transduction histidine kinase